MKSVFSCGFLKLNFETMIEESQQHWPQELVQLVSRLVGNGLAQTDEILELVDVPGYVLFQPSQACRAKTEHVCWISKHKIYVGQMYRFAALIARTCSSQHQRAVFLIGCFPQCGTRSVRVDVAWSHGNGCCGVSSAG